MVELLTVIGIIGIMAGVAVPSIYTWLRTSAIRGAASSVASEINAARAKAISKNVSDGVVFVLVSSTEYRWVVEDDLNPQLVRTPAFNTLTLAQKMAIDEQTGTLQTLPLGISFAAGNDSGFRFNHLGAWCDPTTSSTSCPALGTGFAGVTNGTSGSTITLTQASTGMTRVVQVATGGRVNVVD